MPYITQEQRLKYANIIKEIENIKSIETKGDLEFLVFALMKKYMKDKKWSYSELHSTTYAIQHCADEFRRRFLDKREDEAMSNNGDI